MSTNENVQDNKKDGNSNLPKGQAVLTRESTISDKQASNKLPDWDILPPNQFINPRVKKTQ